MVGLQEKAVKHQAELKKFKQALKSVELYLETKKARWGSTLNRRK